MIWRSVFLSIWFLLAGPPVQETFGILGWSRYSTTTLEQPEHNLSGENGMSASNQDMSKKLWKTGTEACEMGQTANLDHIGSQIYPAKL